MEDSKQAKLYEMLQNMSDYSTKQPAVIEALCKDLMVSEVYAPAMDLLVEAFLTIHSFSLLMFEGIISNASAILRILIEQVATLTVISRSSKAMNEYLKFERTKRKYYSSIGEEHIRIRDLLFQEAGYKTKNVAALKTYLDYGWIRVINDDRSVKANQRILKEAHLDEVISDIDDHLNAFAHGQKSMFSFLNNKVLADKHVSRITMIAGKLFLFLCHAKQELLVNQSMTEDKYFHTYLNARILYLDLNARSTNERIVDFIKCSNNLDRDIVFTLSSLNHMRGLIYQSELNYVQVNNVARGYVIESINFLFMIFYKLFINEKGSSFDKVKTFSDLIEIVAIDKIRPFYNDAEHYIPLNKLIEMTNHINDEWGLMQKDGKISELDEAYLTDLSSLVHTIFDREFPDFKVEELMKAFVPIE